MKTKLILPTVAALTVIVGVAALAQGSGSKSVDDLTFLGLPMTEDQLSQGQEVYETSCASCHGANLEGQPDWKRRLDNGRVPAPPHDVRGHTWHHSDRNLFIVTKGGVEAVVSGYESDMPAFGDILSDADIAAVLSYIKSTWPERQRKIQSKVSANDKGEL